MNYIIIGKRFAFFLMVTYPLLKTAFKELYSNLKVSVPLWLNDYKLFKKERLVNVIK